MFPFGFVKPSKHLPFVTLFCILVMVGVFTMQLLAPDFDTATYTYSFIPELFMLRDTSQYMYLITSVFLHGGFVHLFLNTWFLFLMGSAVESRIGHISFLFWFLLFGVVGNLIAWALNPSYTFPVLSSSGAITGIAGMFIVLEWKEKARYIVPCLVTMKGRGIPVGIKLSESVLPAIVVAGVWLLSQLLAPIDRIEVLNYYSSGIIWFAILPCFVLGALLAKPAIVLTRITRSVLHEE